MSTAKRVVEDKSRRLLETCPHCAPACWRCVALDMERQRDEVEAKYAGMDAAYLGEVEKRLRLRALLVEARDALRSETNDPDGMGLTPRLAALLARLDAEGL